MDAFVDMLMFAPLVVGLMWIYMLPLEFLGYAALKGVVRLLLLTAIFGGILAQESFLSHHEPVTVRGFYEAALFLVEATAILFMLQFYYRKYPSKFPSKPSKGRSARSGIM